MDNLKRNSETTLLNDLNKKQKLELESDEIIELKNEIIALKKELDKSRIIIEDLSNPKTSPSRESLFEISHCDRTNKKRKKLSCLSYFFG